MQLGFVMQADAAPHDDRRFWPDVVAPLVRFSEMSSASVVPKAARNAVGARAASA
jgi:hypothetical protein